VRCHVLDAEEGFEEHVPTEQGHQDQDEDVLDVPLVGRDGSAILEQIEGGEHHVGGDGVGEEDGVERAHASGILPRASGGVGKYRPL